MAPTPYHYLPVPMDELWKEHSPRRCWRGLLVWVLLVLVVGLTIALAILVVRYKSEACQNGLQLQRECHNATQLLEKQLIQIKEGFLAAETRVHTCNQTVVKLESQELQQRKRVQELERENTKLNQMLQETLAKLEQIRKETTPASSKATSIFQLLISLLFLGLGLGILLF